MNQLQIDDPFWNRYVQLVTREIIPYQYLALNDRAPDAEPSHSIRNLRIAAGLEQGQFRGWVFQDTDVAKWLEAVAFSLSYQEDPALEHTADELIRLIGQAQQPNGYLNTHYSIGYPGNYYCNLKEGHELYTAGHFIEAAVAYYKVTGKDAFLKIMCRCADHILEVFHSPGYEDAVPGHEEIELALYKLAEVTGKEAYRDMALEFVDRRGTSDYLNTEHLRPRFIDCWGDKNPYQPLYGQAHLPVRQQTTAEGHAVRALYLYSAMADLAYHYDDEGLKNACLALYQNIVDKRMYITGGIGSSGTMERFTTDYDLPNDTNYSESCASIALAMFCKRMARLTGESRFMDTAELALINTVLAGVAMDGKSFFYVNPLAVIPSACMTATDKNHVKPVRQKWFACACCPPNIARTLASLADYMFLADGEDLWVNLYIGGTFRVPLGGGEAVLKIRSELPWDGNVAIEVQGQESLHGSLRLRIPDYAEDPKLTVNGEPVPMAAEKGYAVIPLQGGQADIRFRFHMPPRLVYANPMVAADVGKAALRKGPLIYCLEETDNGDNLAGLLIDSSSPLTKHREDILGGTVTVTAKGWRWDRKSFGPGLYRTEPPDRVPVDLKFVPYSFWGNRIPGEMTVWVGYI